MKKETEYRVNQAKKEIKVVDKRKYPFFIIDNAFIDGYAKKIKAAGVVVYIALQRHSKDGTAFPGVRHLSKETGASLGYIAKGINILEKWNIINIQKEEGKVNIYVMLDQKKWKNIPKEEWSNQFRKK